MSRSASIERNTSETKIKLSIDLDGNGKGNIHTGIGFFDHMLNAFARHGFFDLDVEVEGDLYVDCHHTIEDVGIVLGEAIQEYCLKLLLQTMWTGKTWSAKKNLKDIFGVIGEMIQV